MSNIIPFGRSKNTKQTKQTKQTKKKRTPDKAPAAGGNIMCRNNHHKWQIDQSQRFDTQSGKLITVDICQRCGEKRRRLT